MEIYYAPAFLRVYKKLDPSLQNRFKGTISKIIDAHVSGKKTPGLGVKQLRGPIWEARLGIKNRVVFTVTQDTLTFVLAGSHDDVRNYLKRV